MTAESLRIKQPIELDLIDSRPVTVLGLAEGGETSLQTASIYGEQRTLRDERYKP